MPVEPSASLVNATKKRRAAFAKRLGDTTALIPAGPLVGRNYRANAFPYRASSHFLYLVGMPLIDAALMVKGGEATLFARPPDASDALWHGPTPDLDAMSKSLGCEVRPLSELANALPAEPVGMPPQMRPFSKIPVVRSQPADDAVADALIAGRLQHDEAAIGELRAAGEATAAAHIAGMWVTRPGLHEYAVLGAMEAALSTRGMGTAYNSIVTVHGEVLHNHSHHHLMADGDLLLADVGAETPGGWAGDVTRTWPVSGTFSGTQRAVYEVVLASQAAAIDKARVGVRFRDIHLTACRVLTEGLVDLGILRGDVDELVADDVHALFFPHGVGHILGLDVHDMEDLGDRAGYAPDRKRSERFGLGFLRMDRDLLPGMAVTVEPGFYQVPALLQDPERTAKAGDRLVRSRLAEFADVRGIRIEDDLLIRADGPPEILSGGAPKSVEEVEAITGMSHRSAGAGKR